MPYVPVQRDEGRILYQSTMDRAKLLGDTLTGLGETLYKRDEENKAFRAKSSALKQVISTNKEQFGLDENTAKLFLSGDPNKSEKENYLNLATFIEGKITAANLAKDQANIKHTNLQGDLLAQQIKQQEGMIQYMKDDEARKAKEAETSKALSSTQPSTKNIVNGATNAAQFLPEQSVSNVSPSITPSATPQAPSNRFRRVPDASVASADGLPVTSSIQPSEAVLPSPVASRSPMVTAAQPIDQYRALRPSDVSFAPAALAASQFAGPMAPDRRVQSALASAPASVAAAAPSLDPLALELARQQFDTGISSPSEQFTLPQIKLSPGAKAIAKSLREQYDDSSAVLERRSATPRLTAGEDEGKAGSLKKKKTITLDEEGIKAILSNPRILVESFGDVMGDPYERAMRNEATDAAFRRNAQMRELERQFGVRTPARRGK
jgi:hypothetical protein